ncbi:hypothetical protein [Marinobacter salicampi]|uniref:hypothetical protein n=1 Tax=Marinobacter salicampi TaxID=435907 RepID=UPI001409761C|nr:hypothetical protein [Marinobacter salicampi]
MRYNDRQDSRAPRLHEEDSTEARSLFRALAIAAVVIAGLSLLVWGGFSWYLSAFSPRPSPFMEPRQAPETGIQLQDDPVADLDEWQAASRDHLQSSGWVDRQNGIVHIPIDQAITLLVEKGVDQDARAGEAEP